MPVRADQELPSVSLINWLGQGGSVEQKFTHSHISPVGEMVAFGNGDMTPPLISELRNGEQSAQGQDKLKDNTKQTDENGQQNGHYDQPEESKGKRKMYKMWGFFPVEQPVKLANSIILPLWHLLAILALLQITFQVNIATILWGILTYVIGGFGVTGGVHRFWTHRSYKAKLPLRIFLAFCFSVAGQNTIFDWVRDHRVHHKYSETIADPHNAKRGFWFAHCGWLMMNKDPEVLRRGKQIDMSDILADPVVRFHQKHFGKLKLTLAFILPSVIPAVFWNESWYNAILSQVFIRFIWLSNSTWLVNSAAHIWGGRPYDKNINPSENRIVSLMALGEGWHNYHHVFPWDYKAAEIPWKINFTTFLIDQFAKIGWAYDLKQPSEDLVRRTIEKHGDGTHPKWGGHMPEVEFDESLRR